MTFTGTLADINTALAGSRLQPTANFNGAATLTITTNDQGNTARRALDTDTVAITVAAVNDAPVNSVPGAQSTNEDTSWSSRRPTATRSRLATSTPAAAS